uniref:(northern house mosquito) hypothetical protein n=1 Tax=Culex pipiens TaxID=7175 RepID=A0A8D8BEI8_CULPI
MEEARWRSWTIRPSFSTSRSRMRTFSSLGSLSRLSLESSSSSHLRISNSSRRRDFRRCSRCTKIWPSRIATTSRTICRWTSSTMVTRMRMMTMVGICGFKVRLMVGYLRFHSV